MTELLLKYLSWPGAIVLIAFMIVVVLRKPLSEAIRRGGVKIGKEGLSIDQAAAVAAVSAQSAEKSPENALALDPEIEQRRSQVRQVGVSAAIREQQARIRADLVKLKLTDNESVEVLVQHLATAQLFHAAEKMYRLIFGGQIGILKHLNLYGPKDSNELRSFYETARANFPTVLNAYPFEAYIGFLKNSGLIMTNDNVRYAITPLGKDFLQWMAAESAPETKPA
jgi:hypothetical protein